jgi:hypothetical protein
VPAPSEGLAETSRSSRRNGQTARLLFLPFHFQRFPGTDGPCSVAGALQWSYSEVGVCEPAVPKSRGWSRGVTRWCRCSLSVAGPFVCRCLTSSAMRPSSHPARRTGRAERPHPALGESFTMSPTGDDPSAQ